MKRTEALYTERVSPAYSRIRCRAALGTKRRIDGGKQALRGLAALLPPGFLPRGLFPAPT